MKRATALLVSVTTLAAITTMSAAFAQDSTTTTPAPSTPAAKTKTKSDVGLPARIPAFVAGATVGIPVAIVRSVWPETKNATRDLVGETSNPILIGLAGGLGLPAGILSGTLIGTFLGVKHAWVGSGDEPFGKESFSLGDMD